MAANNDNSSGESNIALGKKIKIDPIDEKTLASIISAIGKERKKPGSALHGSSKGGSKKPGPIFELCSLPDEEKEIVCDDFDESLKKHVLKDSIVSISQKVFIADRLTGVACPHYWFSIPSSQTLCEIGQAINRGNKGKNQRLHVIAGKIDTFFGAFATLENLFTYLHCVLHVSVSSPVFRDLTKMFHVDSLQTKTFTSKKLEEHYAAVLRSKVFGGASNLIIPAQTSRQTKSLKSPGTFFYSSDNENPFGVFTVKHAILSKRYNIPEEASFPQYSDWENTLANSKNNRSKAVENYVKWTEFAETYGAEATKALFEKLKQKKASNKKRRLSSGGDDEIGLDGDQGVVAYVEGCNFRVSKKPKIEDDDDDDDDDTSSSSSSVISVEEEGSVVSILKSKEEEESNKLIDEFLGSLRIELMNETKRNPKYSDWGDDGEFLEIAEEIDWRGVHSVDDSSRHYKKDVRKIHSLLKKK